MTADSTINPPANPPKGAPVNADTIAIEGRQLVEASAGTGKTYTITNLYLRLILGRGVTRAYTVQEILVLTFTIAATQELKHRISSRLRETYLAYFEPSKDEFITNLVASSENPEQDRKLLTAALQLMDETAIFTIHGFCARVLGEEAFDAGTLFDQAISLDAEQILLNASQDVFRQSVMTLSAGARETALKAWPTPEAMLQAFRPLLHRPGVTITPAETNLNIDLDAVLAKIREVKAIWVSENIHAMIVEAGFRLNYKPVTRLTSMTEMCLGKEEDIFSELWQVYSQAGLKHAVKKGTRFPEHRVLDLIDEIHAVQVALNEVRHNLWHRLLNALKQRVQEIKTTQHLMTLDDLLTNVAAVLNADDTQLAHTLSQRWPIVMIDEFQDTDETQNGIFNRIFEAAGDQVLLMIGDPKQAIYQFRGADIYTYLNARSEASGVYGLDVNHRSTAAMVNATNHLFGDRARFDIDGVIPYPDVAAAERNQGMQLLTGGGEPEPYQVLVCGDESTPVASGRGCSVTMESAAEETARLLNGAMNGDVTIDGEPLTAGNIAFLVRSRANAAEAKAALARRNIQSVYLTLESVLLQETADDLVQVLKAVIEPTNERLIRAALATQVMQCSAYEIDELNHDIEAQQRVLAEFQEYHDLWVRENVGPMIMSLIHRRQLPEKWLRRQDGERQLTNIRHLVEILQTRAAVAPGMHRLLKWFIRERDIADSLATEERQLRLESDENLVKIVTMHAAKGLEYDVVFVPYPLFSSSLRSGEAALYHRQAGDEYLLYAEVGDDEDHRAIALRELATENMRLMYVALTRARYQAYLCLPVTNRPSELTRSAIASLLGIEDYDNKKESLLARLQGQMPRSLFNVRAGETTLTMLAESQADLTQRELPEMPGPSDKWRMHSYTGIAHRLHRDESLEAAPQVEGGYADDDDAEPEATTSSAINRFNLPRGARVGVALHSLMEDADFVETGDNAVLTSRFLDRIGVTLDRDTWQGCVDNWLADILATPLNSDGLRLGSVHRSHRVDEMEFHFPVDCAADVIEFLRQHGHLDATSSQGLGIVHGMMTGLIDLVFRADGKYYVVDYKSNHLGSRFEDYGEASVREAMSSHFYDLQYLIYTVALNRYLMLTLKDYSYAEHFGGVFYLFLRGMNGKDSTTGIYYDVPEEALIMGLDERMGA